MYVLNIYIISVNYYPGGTRRTIPSENVLVVTQVLLIWFVESVARPRCWMAGLFSPAELYAIKSVSVFGWVVLRSSLANLPNERNGNIKFPLWMITGRNRATDRGRAGETQDGLIRVYDEFLRGGLTD